MSTAKQDEPIEAVAPPTGRLWAGVSVFAFGWILALTLVPFVKPGFAYLKGHIVAFFRKVGPPAEVGKWRYRVGLVMFFLPFLLTLLLTHFGPILPGGREATATYLKGGDFWDKLRALFVRDAKAVFPEQTAAPAN